MLIAKCVFFLLLIFCLKCNFQVYGQGGTLSENYASSSLKAEGYTYRKFRKAVLVPAFLIGAGVYSLSESAIINKYQIQEERQQHFPDFHTKVDDYLQFAPVGMVYLSKIAGMDTPHSWIQMSVNLLLAEVFMAGIVHAGKNITQMSRPDSSAPNAFPSGHTAQAFVAATFMHHELKHLSPWYSIGAYSVASGVGVLRVLNNRHWISDVLAGAGVGILTTNLIYLFPSIHPRKTGPMQVNLYPVYGKNSMGLQLIMTL